MKTRTLILACCIGFTGTGLIASAWTQVKQIPAVKAPPAPKQEKDNDTLDVSFASMRHNDTTGEGEFTKFKVVDKETTVIGDLCKVHDKKKTAEATGNLKMIDPQADATGDKAVILYADRKSVV